jgi:hypothetical protein
MMNSGAARPLCAILALIVAAPSGLAEDQAPPSQAAPRQQAPGPALNIAILEGNNAVNSVSLLRSVAPVVEIRDQNEFPVEGATVVFTLPAQGPGGTFTGGGTTFTTRSDARGQAAAPLIVPRMEGRFEIRVTATAGDRRGEASIVQTNSAGTYVGPSIAPRPWYRKWKVWAIIGGAAVAGGVAVAVTRGSGSKSSGSVVITPGVPVFQ